MSKLRTRNWQAWINSAPGNGLMLHVTGDIEVPNPSYTVLLKEVAPQPNDLPANHLLLELIVDSSEGFVPQVLTYKEARFEKAVCLVGKYEIVEIEKQGQQSEKIAQVAVKVMQRKMTL